MNGKRKKAYAKLAMQLGWTEKQLKFHIRKNRLEAAHNHKPLKGQGPKKDGKKRKAGTPCFGKGNWINRCDEHPMRVAILIATEALKDENPPLKAFQRAQEMYDLKLIAGQLSKPELKARINAILSA